MRHDALARISAVSVNSEISASPNPGVAYVKEKTSFSLSVVPKLYLDSSGCGDTPQLRCYVLERRFWRASELTISELIGLVNTSAFHRTNVEFGKHCPLRALA